MRRTRLLSAAASLAIATALLGVPATAAPTWLGPVTISAQGEDAFDHQVATDAAGNVTAVWARSDGTNYRIQASSRSAGTEWSTPVAISVAGQDATRPQVVVDASGTATAVWERTNGVTDQIRTSTRALGGAWSTPVTLAQASQDDVGLPQVAVDGAGNVTAAWSILAAGDRRVQARTRPPGGAWSLPVFLSEAGQNARDHELAGRPGAAGFSAVWTRQDAAATWRVQEVSRSAEGSWGSPATISATGQDARRPQVAVHPDGDVTAIWERYDGSHWRVQARTRRDALTWVVALVTDLSEPGRDAGLPQIAIAPDGATTAVWARSDGTHALVQAASRPGVGPWSVVPDTLSQAGQPARAPQVAVDGAGNATVVWARSDGSDSRIQSRRRSAGGAWGSPTTLSAAGEPAEEPRVAADGAGDVVALWHRFDGVAGRVQASALDTVGPAVTSLVVPASATVGQPVSVSVTAIDSWSPITSIAWSFGDGSSASGASATHTYAATGSPVVTLTLTDAVGNTTTRTAQITITSAPIAPAVPTAPTITTFTLKPRTIEIDGPRKKTRTTATLVLTTAASVRLVCAKVGVKKPAATLTTTLKNGRNTFRLTAKIGKKRLKPGTYKVTARATNTTGTSKPVTVKLRVIR